MNKKFAKYLPHLVAVVLFTIVAVAFFKPLFSGYVIKQYDTEKFVGMSQEIQDYRDYHDEENLWTGTMFSGMPAYQISVSKKNEGTYALLSILSPVKTPGMYFIYAMISFYILLLVNGVNPWVSIAGAVGFAFSTYFVVILEVGHNTKLHAIAWAPMVIAGFQLLMRNKYLVGSGLLLLGFSLELYANHFQITYYLAFILGVMWLYYLVEAVLHKNFKNLAISTVLGLLIAGGGVAANYSNVFGTLDYMQYTTRGDNDLTADSTATSDSQVGLDIDYIFNWSFDFQESFSLAVAKAKGTKSAYKPLKDIKSKSAKDLIREVKRSVPPQYQAQLLQINSYWGNQPITSGAVYIGAVFCFLAIAGLFAGKNNLQYYLLGITLFSVLLAMGKNAEGFNTWMIEKFPLYNKFRAVTMSLVIAEICIPLMAMLFIRDLFKYKEDYKKSPNMLYLGSGVGIAFFLFLLVGASGFDFTSAQENKSFGENLPFYLDGLEEVRSGIFTSSVFKSLFLSLIAFGTIWAFLFKDLKTEFVALILFVIIGGDLLYENKEYLNANKTKKEYDFYLPKIMSRYRIPVFDADRQIITQEAMTVENIDQLTEERVGQIYTKNGIDPNDRDDKKLLAYKLRAKDGMTKDASVEEIISTHAKSSIINENTNYRVLDLTNPWNSSRASFYHKSMGGYHGAKLMKYQNLLDKVVNEELGQIQSGNHPMLDAMNMKYIIFGGQGNEPLSFPNKTVNGPAWFVDNLTIVASNDEEVESIKGSDLKATALIQKANLHGEENIGKDSLAVIEMVSYNPSKLVYKTNNTQNGFGVFSEIYYPDGWKAYIDGEETPISQVDYILRGLSIPAGEHEVVFEFKPEKYLSMQKTTAIVSWIVILLSLGLIIFGLIKQNKVSEEAAA